MSDVNLQTDLCRDAFHRVPVVKRTNGDTVKRVPTRLKDNVCGTFRMRQPMRLDSRSSS